MTAAPLHEPNRDLEVARRLALAGVPIFVAKADPNHQTGFALPPRWQLTQAGAASLAAIDAWQPGDALCALMGVRMDLLDVDPRNGGDATVTGLRAAGLWPRSFGRAATPSGGTHDFVARLKTGSRDNVRPGLDVKGGRDGVVERAGRGFAFIAPTVRPSKVTGELEAYVWLEEPDLDDIDDDDTGEALAEIVKEAIGSKPTPPTAPGGVSGSTADAMHTGPIRSGERHAKLVSYAGRLRDRGLSYDEAEALFLRRWEDCDQPPAAPYPVTREEALEKLQDVFRRYTPAPVDLAEATFGELPTSAPLTAPASNVTPLRPEYADHLDEAEASDAALEYELAFRRAVAEQVAQLRIRDEARRTFQREQQAALTAPAFVDLGDFLSVEDDEATHRIDGLWPSGGRVLLAAAFKAGKSTAVGNVVRSLVDGDLFLSTFPTAPVTRKVVMLDNELDERNLRRWLRDQGIRNVDKVVVVPMRGKVGTFDLLDPHIRAQWAAQLREHDAEIVIFDCLRPVLDALGLSEDKDAGRFLVQFDALLAEAGAEEALVVHHTGHDGERSRGDSRLRDWPDAEWRITRLRDGDGPIDPAAPRFFAAYGRDVDVEEGRLEYDQASRHLTYAEGSRKDAQGDRDFEMIAPRIVELVGKTPPAADRHGTPAGGWSKTAIETGVDFPKIKVRKVLGQLVDRGLLQTVTGPRDAVLHVLTDPSTARSSLTPLTPPSPRQRGKDSHPAHPAAALKGGGVTGDPDRRDQKDEDLRRGDNQIPVIDGLLSVTTPDDCPCGRSASLHGKGQWRTCGTCSRPWHAFGIGKLGACPTCSPEATS